MRQRNFYLINKVFKSYWIASVVASLATTLTLVVDGIIVSQLLGPAGFSAVNLSFPLLRFILTFHYLLNIGSGMRTAFAMGKGNSMEANRYFTFAVMANGFFGVLFIFIGLFFSEQAAAMLCRDVELFPLVHQYSRIVLLTAPLYLLLPSLCVFIRTDGSPRLTTTALIVANTVNLFLDIIFIKYFEWGIEGAALATGVGNIVGIIVALSHFFNKLCSLKLCNLTRKLAFSQVFMAGLASALVSVLFSIRLLSMNHIAINYLDGFSVATLALSFNLFCLFYMFIDGASETIRPLGAVLIGQEDYMGLHFAVKRTMRTLIIAIVGSVIFVELFAEIITRLFDLEHPAVAKALRVIVISFIPFAISDLVMVIYQLQKRYSLAIIAAVAQALMVVLVMYLFAKIDASAVWYSFIIGETVVLVLILILSQRVRRSNKSLSVLTLLPSVEANEQMIDMSMECTEVELNRFLPRLDEFLQNQNVSLTTRNRVELCYEELLLNIINHGGGYNRRRYVDMLIKISACDINICIRDNGRPFDPVRYSENAGIGLLIVRGVCQKMEYKYLFNQNTVFIKVDK